MLPLSGIKVIDWTTAMAGPYGGMVFADLGAEVIHVDRPGPRTTQISTDFSRNKKSIAINLREKDGNEIMSKLVENADILLENFSPGAADRQGLSFDEVSKINPKIIYISVKGYGDGPYEYRPAQDPEIEAETGVLMLQGLPDGEPVRHPAGQIDKYGGTWGVFSAIVALIEREKTGKGQYIKIGMYEDSALMISRNIALYQLYNILLSPAGSGVGTNKFFETLNWWIYIGIRRDDEWKRFCNAFDITVEDEVEFKTVEARTANPGKVEKIIQDVLITISTEDIIEKLEEAEIPYAPVNTPRELISDPHLNATESLVLQIPGGRDRKTPVPVPMLGVRTSDYNPCSKDWGGFPEHSNGADTVEILRMLKYSEDQINDLRKRKVVWPYLEAVK
ncbi:MAG: CaiB/BaiF CoA-transferase family protein [Candidatus Bathyarchaeota archaeon]